MRPRLATVFLPLLLAGLLAGCAYFNAFYLAKKNFRNGEYERRKTPDKMSGEAQQSYQAAIKWAKVVIEHYPDSRYVDDSLYILAMSNYHQRQYVVARDYFDDLLDNHPDSNFREDALYYKARCFMGLNQFENARLILNELVKSEDGKMKGQAGLTLVEITKVNEQWEDLLAGAQAVIDSDPDEDILAQSILYKGEALYHLGRYEECRETLRGLEDFKIEPEQRFLANSFQAQSLAELEKYDDALSNLTSLEGRGEFARFAPRIRFEIGRIYERQGNTELAIDTYTKMAGDYPDSLVAKEAWYRIGSILIEDLANAKEAKDAFNKAKNVKSTEPKSFAVDAANKAAQIDSMFARIDRIDKLKDDQNQAELLVKTRFLLAELYMYSLDKPDSALTQYNAILEETPDGEYAVMSEFFMKRHELEKNGKLSEETEKQMISGIVEKYPDSEFTGKLREYIGVENTTPQVVAFKRAEEARLSGRPWQEYIPLYEEIVNDYPGTRSAYRAQFTLAYLYEHEAGDQEKAMELYRRISEYPPGVKNREFVEMAKDKLEFFEREPELLAQIEEYLADYEARKEKGILGLDESELAGETAISTDTGYTGMRKIRERNARIRSRYYTN